MFGVDCRYKRDVNSHLLLYTKQNRRLYEIVCSVSKSAEREGLATSQPCGLLRLTPFPSARRGSPCELHSQGVDKSTIFVSHAYVYKRAYAIGIKNKRCRLLDTLLLRFVCGERGSRTYEIIENHKISIRCKLSVYKIVKFIETHRVHFDI